MLDKEALVSLIEKQFDQISELTNQVTNLTKQVTLLTEQITLMNQRAFGKKTEKAISTTNVQLSLFDDAINEAEVTAHGKKAEEPNLEETLVKSHTRKKRKGKRNEDLSGYPEP